MPISGEIIPSRDWSQWFSIENPCVCRFTFTGIDWTGFFVSANANSITLFSASPLTLFVGDTFRISGTFGTVTVAATRITNTGAVYTYNIFFNPPVAYNPAGVSGVEKWIGRNDYIEIIFRDGSLIGTDFYKEKIRVSPSGICDYDFGAALRAWTKSGWNYDTAGSINQLQPDSQKGFWFVWTFYEGGAEYGNFFSNQFFGIRAAKQLGDTNSSNMIEYVPNPFEPTHLAKWLTKFETKPVWSGVPNYLSFIFSEYMENPTLNFGMTSIPLDGIQNIGVNHILLDESWLTNGNCFELGGDEIDPPPPPYNYKRWREITFHIQNSRSYVEYVALEPIDVVETRIWNGLGVSGLRFYINGVPSANFSAWLLALSSITIGTVLRVEVVTPATALPYGSDWLLWIRYGTNDTTLYPTYRSKTLGFGSAKVGADFLLRMTGAIEFDPTPANHAPMYVGIRTATPVTESYVDFPYNLSSASDITALNAALVGKTDYALHFAYVWNGKFPTGTALASGNTDGQFRYRYLDASKEEWYIFGDAGENSNPNGIPEILGQSKGFDGVSTYTTIGGVSQSNFNRGKTVVISCNFYTTDLVAARTICSSRTNLAGAFINGIDFYTSNNEIIFRYIDRSFNFIAYIAPIKYGWNTITFVSDGSGSDSGAFMIANGVRAVRIAKTGGWNAASWDATNNPVQNTFTIGSVYNDNPQLYFKDKIANLNVWTDVPLPTNHELRCLQNTHNYNGGIYQGETYDPTSGFWLKSDYKTGTPIITSSAAIVVNNFGAITFPTFLP